jgi:hypothetical protein
VLLTKTVTSAEILDTHKGIKTKQMNISDSQALLDANKEIILELARGQVRRAEPIVAGGHIRWPNARCFPTYFLEFKDNAWSLQYTGRH